MIGQARAAGLALVALMLPLGAAATTVSLRPLDALTEEADLIVEARVVAARAEQPEPNGPIFTVYEMRALDWLRPGPRGPETTFVVRQPGGTIGDLTMVAVGAAHFAPGEELLLFAKDYGSGIPSVANLMQGALRIAPARDGSPRRIRDLERHFPEPVPADLAAFERRIRERLGSPRP